MARANLPAKRLSSMSKELSESRDILGFISASFFAEVSKLALKLLDELCESVDKEFKECWFDLYRSVL
jgi:hypothetical protein